jgi:hypothetical protein
VTILTAEPSSLSRRLVLAAVLLCITLVYGNVITPYFCADDDFVGAHRTRFVDARDPAKMFTAPQTAFKYRPLWNALNLVTYRMGRGSAVAYRIRNLLFHLANVLLLYYLSRLLLQPAAVGLAAALLFGLHPLADQSVIGAIWTQTVNHFFYLLTLVVFIRGSRSSRPFLVTLASGLAAATGLLFYDVNVAVFGSMFAWLIAARFLEKEAPKKRVWGYLAAVTLGVLALYLGMRVIFLPAGFGQAAAGIPTPGAVLKNIGMYAAAAVVPLDSVLAARWFGRPFPSEPGFLSGAFWLVALSGAVVILSALFAVWKLLKARRPLAGWAADLFLLFSAALPLVPVLVFSGHASETYLYLPMAFLSLVGASLLFDVCMHWSPERGAAVFLAAVVGAAAWFGVATVVKNECVAACGATAHRILTSVPVSKFQPGSKLTFFDAPGGLPSRHYGFYGFTGLDTVGNRPSERSRSLQYGLQLISGNEGIRAEVLDDMDRLRDALREPAGRIFFSVRWDGAVTELHPGSQSFGLPAF